MHNILPGREDEEGGGGGGRRGSFQLNSIWAAE